MYKPLSAEEERIGKAIIDAAFQVHRELGPGLLEKVYEVCFVHVLRKNGFEVSRQVFVPIRFDGIEFPESLKMDVLVNDKVICELKAVETVHPLWRAQVLSHLRLCNKRLGYVLNFSTPLMKDGIQRLVR